MNSDARSDDGNQKPHVDLIPQDDAGFLSRLGPGLITGAADDDPSGIATYSQVGAQFGFAMLWTVLFTFPLMTAMQEICGRLGRITGKGVAGSLRKHYPRPLLMGLVSLLCLANIFNIGADIEAMGACAQLVFKGPANLYILFFGGVSLALQIWVPYRKYVHYLKWLTLVLFAYVATAFVIHVPWKEALYRTVVPAISWNKDYFMALVAVLGTTISPYLFFWQTSQEAEEVSLHEGQEPLKKKPSQAPRQFRRIAMDTRVGMAFSNIVAFFIILTTAITLHSHGNGTVSSAADAAKALEPLAGKLAFWLFAWGIIGTGLLAVPVLAGSAAYAVAETFRWKASLESKPGRALGFYWVIAGATGIGIALTFFGLDPIRALFLSAVINGLAAVPLMIVLMFVSENRRVVGQFRLPGYLRVFGWVATAVMLAASVAFLVSEFAGKFQIN
jgi:NRAMP (natural resistance-associated macrophage protein)-like metal ion transporter